MLKLKFKIKYRQFLDLKLLSFRRLQPLLNLPPLGGSVSVIYFICISIFPLIAVWLGSNFLHYILIYIPILAISFLLSLKVINEKIKKEYKIKKAVALVMAFLIFVLPFGKAFFTETFVTMKLFIRNTMINLNLNENFGINNKKYNFQTDESIEKIVSCIPKEDYDSVWTYNVHPMFYVVSDILPCYKYFILQSGHSSFDKNISEEISEYLKSNSPKWIAISSNDNKTLEKKLEEEYEFKIFTYDGELGGICLYHLKD